ncbi:host cell division inhibitor Icd-like protein [Citrobacter portucalensis]|uniref:host cell division inhibitor Icd-like protein n=1 Tax=Citrobacter portucalensis TaxID=1639133 RepID=UPI00226B6A1A|nr:host cell division inhibitor Icd-like protein [Citrobacter portucalensis]MCX8985685.1 host cell division inhibitor Icd-like protein [Citrobacter portucalensis]
MNSNAMTSIGQGRCHAENDASGILSLSGWRGDNNGLTIGAYKNGLPPCANQYYTAKAPAKSGVGRRNPVFFKATVDADSVFFYVVTSALPHSAAQIRVESMVALAGQPSGWPGSLKTGIPTPVNVTTNQERRNSGGDSKFFKEAATMATTLATPQTKFIWLIAAVRRDCPTIKAVIHHIAANSEREARRTLAQDHVTFFAGRVPVQEVRHV